MKRIEIDGELPADNKLGRHGRDLAVVIHNMPSGTTSLDFLLPAIERVRELRIYSGRCTDTTALEHAINLQYLDLADTRPKVSVDFSRCPLTEFTGRPTPHYESAFRSPGLKLLGLFEPDPATLLMAPPSIRTLHLDKIRDRNATSVAAKLPLLRRLDVRNAVHFDAAILRSSASMEYLNFTRVKEISGLGAALDGRQIGSLYFETCPIIHDLDTLARVNVRRVMAIGQGPFTPDFYARVPSESKQAWVLPWMP